MRGRSREELVVATGIATDEEGGLERDGAGGTEREEAGRRRGTRGENEHVVTVFIGRSGRMGARSGKTEEGGHSSTRSVA